MSQYSGTREKLDRLLAEPFNNAGACEALCRELEVVAEELDGATGRQRVQLLARLHAIETQRTALHCSECFFQ